MERSQINELLDLCRNVIDKNYSTKPDIADWETLYKLATRGGVTAFVYDSVSDMPMPRKLALTWALSTENIEARYHKQYSAAQHLSEFYRENGIRMLILKGIGLSHYYPRPEVRECGDIDIYLFDGYEKGNELVKSEIHYHDKHAVFTFEGVTIENHYEFVTTERKRENRDAEKDLQHLLAKYGVVEKDGFILPSAEFNLFFTLRHAANHLADGIPLRQVIDWSVLLQKERERLNAEVREIIKYNRLERLFDAMTSIAMRLTGEDFSQLLFNPRRANKYADVLIKVIENKKWRDIKHTIFGKIFQAFSQSYHYSLIPDSFIRSLGSRTKGYIRNRRKS